MATFCITGAYGYSGRYIASRLLDEGHRVRTLTRSGAQDDPFDGRVPAYPMDFEDAAALDQALSDVDVLVNTYWVRFSKAGFSQTLAVENTQRLFEAARRAGVSRVVHTSITNPSEDSPYEYFRGKARLEAALVESGLPHSILRPAVFFGGSDVLLNNIAWLLRRFPVFAIVGDGAYRLQPIHVEDYARLVVEEAGRDGNRRIDAIGPETYSYRELVELIGRAIGAERSIRRVPRWVGLSLAKALGVALGDVLLTGEEIDALADDLLCTDSPPAGTTALSDWLPAHAETLGTTYANELARRRPSGR